MLTFAFCTYNRARRLERLVAAMRAQACPVPFEILAVNNNSPDDTVAVLDRLAALPGAPLRYVTEPQPGIVPARNRVLTEAQNSDYLVFIDDDELPHDGLLVAAYDALAREGADCVGGRVVVDFGELGRPRWLGDDLLSFLAAVDHGPEPFWIESEDTPVWTSNIAFRMDYLRRHSLRFDARYNRKGHSASDTGGGEDVVMLRRLLAIKARIRYRPDMAVTHGVEPWRLRRSYFLRLHYLAGVRLGLHETPDYPMGWLRVPPFMIRLALRKSWHALVMFALGRACAMREAMNAAHAFGLIRGVALRGAVAQQPATTR